MNVFRLLSLLLITLTASSAPAEKKRRFITIPDQKMKSSHTAVIVSAAATVLGALAVTISKSRKNHQSDEKATQLSNDEVVTDNQTEEEPEAILAQKNSNHAQDPEEAPDIDALITMVRTHKPQQNTDINKAIGLLLDPKDINNELHYLAQERSNVEQERQELEARVKLAEKKKAKRKQHKKDL